MHRFERDLMSALSDAQLPQLLTMVAVLQERIAAIDPNITFGIG